MSKFAVDPGHGCYPDTGAEGYLNEQNCALDIANKVISKLRALGHEAWNARPFNACSVTDSLQKRCDSAAYADYLVSIHLNAGGGKGSEVFAMSAAGNVLASKVLKELVSLGFVNRGVKDGSGLYVIKHSNPVAILIEVCFVDNQTDTNLYNQLGIEAIANAIVKGLTGQSTPAVKPNESIRALQYDLNIDYNAKLTLTGAVDATTIAALKGIQSIIVKDHKSNVVKWIQQKLIKYGFLGKGQDTGVYDAATFQAITTLQKAWGRSTSGIMNIETWDIFLAN